MLLLSRGKVRSGLLSDLIWCGKFLGKRSLYRYIFKEISFVFTIKSELINDDQKLHFADS